VVLALPGATFAHPGVARDIVNRREGGTARAGRRLSPAALRGLLTGEEPLSLERAVANGLVDLAIEDDVALSDLLRVWSGPAGEPIRRLKRVARSVDTLTPTRSLLVEERSNEPDES
jgi:enoyl-CoA hydratase/carnithine racemase